MSIATPIIFLLLHQQIDEAEISKAIARDAAAARPPQAPPSSSSLPSSPPPSVPAAPAAPPAAAITPPPPPAEAAPSPPPAAEPPPSDAASVPAGMGGQAAVRRPGSSLLNPAISVILDGTFGYYGRHRADFAAAGVPVAGDDPSPDREGFGMQEVEVAFQSAIDPYLEGAVFLTIPNLDGLEVEEGYLVTTSLPWNLQFKAGTFRSQMGRNNTQHLHLQSFTRRPLMTALLFGADGLRGLGAQASVLLPLPWFATFYAESFGLDAPDNAAMVATFGGGDRRTPDNLTYTAVLEQYWDLTDDASLMLGLNAATGRLYDCRANLIVGSTGPTACGGGAPAPPRSWLTGGDLTYHWKPANESRTYASLQWTTEFFLRAVADGGPTAGAGYTEPVVQFARRWYVGGRFDLVGAPRSDVVPRRYGYAGSLTFAPSEFSRFRLYAQEITGPGIARATVAFFQTEFSMGAHGAHPY